METRQLVAAHKLVVAHKECFALYEDDQMRIYAEVEGGLHPMQYVSAHHLDEFDAVTRAIIDGALYALVYDGQPEPRLIVDYRGERTRIDVWTGAVLDGDIGESGLAVALRLVESESKRLSRVWQDMHRDAESAKRLLALADYMDALPPERYDQTRTEHDDGSPACLDQCPGILRPGTTVRCDGRQLLRRATVHPTAVLMRQAVAGDPGSSQLQIVISFPGPNS